MIKVETAWQNPMQKVLSLFLCSYHTIILSDHSQTLELGPRNALPDHGCI